MAAAAASDFYTPLDQIPTRVNALRAHGVCNNLDERRRRLHALLRLVNENATALQDAVNKDLHKHPVECELTEIQMIRNDIADHLDHLDEWAAPVAPHVGLVNKFDGCQIVPQPLGVILIIGAWNYPVQLIGVPMVGALSAGNTVVIKPSEMAVHSAKLFATLIPKYFASDVVTVINGAIDETQLLLKQKFDKILYTGGGRVGKIIMKAAAEHLTPVVLELGGKSPAYVDKDTSSGFLSVVGRRLAWGRFSNCGQTCIAPDYVLCHPSVMKPLAESINKALIEYFGQNPQKSADYGRIINKGRFQALMSMLKGQEKNVAVGGQSDENDLYIAPTVLTNVDPQDAVMQDEIFGPILPMVAVQNVDEAIDFINARDKPLALYVFSQDKSVCKKVLNNTTSGSAMSNDCLMQAAVAELPFGGVGGSGMGAYHGKFSFDCFSHQRAVMNKDLSLEAVMSLRYPPYSTQKLGWLTMVAGKKPAGALTHFFHKFSPLIKLFGFGLLLLAIFKPHLIQTNPLYQSLAAKFSGHK